jgi:hypothetical protein
MTTVSELREHVKFQVLDARALERTVSMDSFATAYELASQNDRNAIVMAINTMKLEELRTLIRRIVFLDNTPTIRELRAWAKSMNIPDYMCYKKDALMSLIRARENGKAGTRQNNR